MNFRSRASVLAAALLLSATARAGVIEYDITNVGGSNWRYDYTVTNDELAGGMWEFTIWFALGLYESLSVAASPASWDSLVVQPDPNLPADGFFDSVSLDLPLARNASVGGFSVLFTWLGTGTPGSQPFDFVNPETFVSIDSGVTRLRVIPDPDPDPTPVPEPAIGLLLAASLAATTFAARRRRVQ
jgi:hypothetical protein